MPETATKATSTKQDESYLISRIAFGCLGVLLMTIVFAYAVLYFGNIRGEEFSPHAFQRRTFVYYEIPLIGLQITPKTFSTTTDDLEKYLVAQKLFPKSTEPEDRWDLVLASQGSGSIVQGDAHILSQYLDAVNKDGEGIWQKWSEKHVGLAKVLWPAVAEAARHELYSFVPDLFLLAQSASAPDQLQQRIDQLLADKYLLVAETLAALDQKEVAAELSAEALRHAPDRAVSQGSDE